MDVCDMKSSESKVSSDLAYEPLSPKRQKTEVDGQEEEWPYYTAKEEKCMMDEQIKKSKGFEVDFEKFRTRHHFFPVHLAGSFFVEESERNVVLLERLSREALELYNQEKGTDLKFEKVVKANWRLCVGVMFYITFEVIDPSSGNNQPILYQAKVRYFYEIITEVIFCRPRPPARKIDQEAECPL